MAVRHWIRWSGGAAAACAVAALAVSFGACSNPARFGRDIVATKRHRLADVQASRADVIAQFPSHADSRATLDSLCDAIIGDGIAKDKPSAIIRIIESNPNEAAGLYAFQIACSEGLKPPELSIAEFCRAIRARVPGTSVSAMALDHELQIAAGGNADRFFAACKLVLSAPLTPAESRVVWLSRANYRREHGEPKLAALDYLRVWSAQPEKAKELRLEIPTRACLREAGFVLEAETFDESSDLAGLSRELLVEFEKWDTESLAALYFKSAPSIESLSTAALPQPRSAVDEAIHWARIGRLAIHARDGQVAHDAYLKFAGALGRLGGSPDARPDSHERLAPIQSEIISSARYFFGDDELARSMRASDQRLSTLSLSRLQQSLDQSWSQYFEAALSTATQRGDAEAAALIERQAQLELANKNPKSAAELYERFIERFPESANAPAIMISAASTYKDALKQSVKAAELLGLLGERFPASDLAAKAKLDQALYYYEAEKREDALLSFQEFLELYPTDNRTPIALYFAALSEASLGMVSEAEQRMMGLIRDHGQSAVAPRAYLWMGTTLFARQDFTTAKHYLTELQARYPESEFAAEAHRITEQLKDRKVAATQ